jgi:hypothetical protein
MNTTAQTLTTVLASTLLAGCYAQVQDSSVSLTQTEICGGSSQCIGGGINLGVLSTLIPPVPINLGDSGILTESQSKQGPVTFNGNLTLNQIVLTMDPTSVAAGANFSKIQTVQAYAALNGDTCSNPSGNSNCRSIASFDSPTGPPAPGTTLVLTGDPSVNLLDVTNGGHQLSVVVNAKGNAPAGTWNASLELDMGISARASFP